MRRTVLLAVFPALACADPTGLTFSDLPTERGNVVTYGDTAVFVYLEPDQRLKLEGEPQYVHLRVAIQGVEVPSSDVQAVFTSSDEQVIRLPNGRVPDDDRTLVRPRRTGTSRITATWKVNRTEYNASGEFAVSPSNETPPPPVEAPVTPTTPRRGLPNEPKGFVAIVDDSFQKMPGGDGSAWTVNSTNNLSISTAAPGLISPPSSLRSRTEAGECGTGSHTMYTSAISDAQRYASEVYIAASRVWDRNWRNQHVGVKFLWPNFERESNSPYTAFDGPRMRVSVNFQGEPWGNRNLMANRGPDSHRYLQPHLGKPVLIEYYLKVNTIDDNGSKSKGRRGLPNRANGVVRAWVTVDGRTELVLEYEDVKFHHVDRRGRAEHRSGKTGEGFEPGRFRQLKWSETYGGCNAPRSAAPADMYIHTDHIYASVPRR